VERPCPSTTYFEKSGLTRRRCGEPSTSSATYGYGKFEPQHCVLNAHRPAVAELESWASHNTRSGIPGHAMFIRHWQPRSPSNESCLPLSREPKPARLRSFLCRGRSQNRYIRLCLRRIVEGSNPGDAANISKTQHGPAAGRCTASVYFMKVRPFRCLSLPGTCCPHFSRLD
jgi:hypothetical protein